MQTNTDHIIRDCCEAEVAEFGKPDTICITVDDLREIVQRHSPGQCLHQIQEPSSAEQAAWHAGLDEGRAQAVPAAVAVPAKVVEALEMLENGALNVAENAKNRGDGYDEGYANAMAKMARETLDSLAATPAAAAPVEQPEPDAAIKKVMGLIADLELEAADVGYGHGSQRLVNEKRAGIETDLNTLLAGVSVPAAQAAKVTMPSERRPITDAFWAWWGPYELSDYWFTELHKIASDAWNAALSSPQAQADAREAQLLAFAVSEIRRDEMEHEPVLYVSKGQLDNHRDPDGPDSTAQGRYLPARVTPSGKFTTPLFAAPQAHADARDAGKLHFWVADDPDTAHESLHEAVMEAFETNGVQPGGFVEIQREISLPNILVRITSTKPFAFEEVPDATIAAQAAQQGGAAC